jgi:PAS domain S-box-containing protein
MTKRNIVSAMASRSRDSESLHVQLLVDSIPSLVHTSRPDGYLDYFNKPWLEYLGVTLDQVTGWNWTAFIHPEDVEGILAQWRACLLSGETFEYETRVRSANGDYRWMFHRKVPLRDAQGGIVKWYGSSLDIDERKTAEEQLHRNSQELQRSEFYLAEGQRLAHMGSWAFNPDGFYYWSPELFRMHGLDPASKPPSLQQYLDCVHPQDRESMEDLIKGLVARASHFDATKRIVRPDGEVRHIRCVGALLVDNQNLTKYVGSALDVTEHELLTQDLHRREAYLAEAQRLSHTGSWAWNLGTGALFWSQEMFRICGYEPQQTGPTWAQFLERVHAEDRPQIEQRAKMETTAKQWVDSHGDFRIVLPDKTIKHLHSVAHPALDASGEITEIIGTVMDVTEHTHLTHELERREAYLAEAQRLSHTGSFGWKPDTGEIVWSEETYRIFEYERAKNPTIDMALQRVHPEDRSPAQEIIERAAKAGTDFENECRLVMASGAIKYVQVQAHALHDSSGNIEFVGAVTDISERKTAEGKIREQEAELRQIVDLVPQLVAVFGPDGERLYANRVALDHVGLSLEEWRHKPGGLFRPGWLIHPDDRDRAARSHSDSARCGGSAYESELRVQAADESYRWFLVRFNPLRDERGQIMRWYVVATDIDERKRAEERLRHENVALREEVDKASMFEEIVGTSRALKSVLSLISKVAPSASTVLITGETGTGKELVARAIHRRSDRVSRSFVSVNCAAIPRDLIASELFGHEKGAFTGATQQRPGRFELANGGTIFLDEVGELPAETQIALLRVLQEHEFERVGGTRQIRVDVRVIAATNRDLQAAIRDRSFRSDLFYRLNVFPIDIPPLRERREDIRLLVEYFIDRYARKTGKRIRDINTKTLELLESYPWPGNIRELQNVIERSVLLCETEIFSIDEHWLPQPPPPTAESRQQVELPQTLLVQEKYMIEAALKDAGGRVSGPTGAAVKLGIPRSTLESKIRSLKINKNRFRPIPGS